MFRPPIVTNHLREDLQSTMSMYSAEKEQLVRQLNTLETGERSISSTSMASSSDQVFSSGLSSPKKSTYFRAPNIAASTSSGSVLSNHSFRDYKVVPTEKKRKEKRDAEKIKKEKEMLKLPVIHSARFKRSEWDSGNFTSESNLADSSLYSFEPLPGINAAKTLMLDSMKIPSIHDPQRTDKAFDTNKSKKDRKKVTFADESRDNFLGEVKNQSNAQNDSNASSNNKSGSKKGVPKINITSNQFSYTAKPSRPRKTSLLPPLDLSQMEVRKNPRKVTDGVNQWKSVYSNILNPEERMRALTDILHAVRLKKIENEMAMKYGPLACQEMDRSQMVNDYLLATASEKITYTDVTGQRRHGSIPSPRKAMIPMGHRSSPYHLQNYLRQMQKSRRYADHMNDRSARHAPGNLERPAIQDTIRNNPSPVSVKA